MEAFYSVNVVVNGLPLQKHRSEYGDYVLSTPGTSYEISLQRIRGDPAVVEIFVDGQSVLLPPSQTRLLTNAINIKGFEKRRIIQDCPVATSYLALPDPRRAVSEAELGVPASTAEMKIAFEYTTFVFDFPQMDENRTDPDLGSIRVEFYEPLQVEMPNNQRRPPLVTQRNGTMQPRQGKESSAVNMMTTREGNTNVSDTVTLNRQGPTHCISMKGDHKGTLLLHYYNGLTHCGAGDSRGGPGTSSWFGGLGHRLGGDRSRAEAIVLLSGEGRTSGAGPASRQPFALPANNVEDQDLQRALTASRLMQEREQRIEEDWEHQLREAMRLSLQDTPSTLAIGSAAASSNAVVAAAAEPEEAPAPAGSGSNAALEAGAAAIDAAEAGAGAQGALVAAAAETEEAPAPAGSGSNAALQAGAAAIDAAEAGAGAQGAFVAAAAAVPEEAPVPAGSGSNAALEAGAAAIDAAEASAGAQGAPLLNSGAGRAASAASAACEAAGQDEDLLPTRARVFAQCPGWGQQWFSGIVLQVVPDGAVEVLWDEDGRRSRVSRECVRLVRAESESASSLPQQPLGEQGVTAQHSARTPPQWEAFYDDTSGTFFYCNSASGDSQWVLPPGESYRIDF